MLGVSCIISIAPRGTAARRRARARARARAQADAAEQQKMVVAERYALQVRPSTDALRRTENHAEGRGGGGVSACPSAPNTCVVARLHVPWCVWRVYAARLGGEEEPGATQRRRRPARHRCTCFPHDVPDIRLTALTRSVSSRRLRTICFEWPLFADDVKAAAVVADTSRARWEACQKQARRQAARAEIRRRQSLRKAQQSAK